MRCLMCRLLKDMVLSGKMRTLARIGDKLTYWGSDSHDDAVSRVLDEVDDVAVVEGVDVHVVHRQDPVTHLQPPAPLGGRTWRENIFINTVNIFTIFYLLDTDQE